MKYWIYLWTIQGFAAFNLTWGMPAVGLDSNPPIGDTDSHAVIAIDSMGNAVAAWSRTTGKAASEEIWASVYNHAVRVWAPTLKISGSGSAEHPQVAIDSQGNATLIWEEGFPTQIQTRSLSPNGIWTPDLSSSPTTIHNSKNAQTLAQLAIDGPGNILTIWMEYYNGKEHIHSAQKPLGMPWKFLGKISSKNHTAALTPSKALAINPSGTGAACWQELDKICLSTFVNGAWSDVQMFGKNASEPAVGIDHLGKANLVWSQENTIYSQTPLLTKPLVISNPGFVAAHPDIGVDAEGNAIVVFERYDSIHKFISSSILAKNSSSWSLPIDISGPSPLGALVAGYPVISVNSIGDAVAIWKEFTGTHIVIQGTGYSLNTWSLPKTLSSPNDNAGANVPAYDISVVLNDAGNILAIWPEDPSMKGTFQIKSTTGAGLANQGTHPPLIDPETYQGNVATGVQVLHRFPAHADLINILKWSPSGKVDHFNVYRNNLNTLIGQTQRPEFEDHQRIPKEKVTYLITAVDSFGQESPPITIIVNPLKI